MKPAFDCSISGFSAEPYGATARFSTGPSFSIPLFGQRRDGSATGVTAAVRGQLWRLIHADLSAIRWRLGLGPLSATLSNTQRAVDQDKPLRQFPTGDFGLQFSAIHEYRSGVRFPIDGVPRSSRGIPAIGPFRRCWKSGSSARPSRGNSGICSASATRRSRTSACRGRRTSTASAGSSTIDKCLCHFVG